MEHITCRYFLSKVSELALEQHVFQPPHVHGNTIDLVLTNKEIMKNIDILHPLLSDPSLVYLELNVTPLQIKQDSI